MDVMEDAGTGIPEAAERMTSGDHLPDGVAPLLIEELPSRNLLQSRELCQAWEEEWIHQNESISSTLYPPSSIQTFDNDFRNSDKVQEFMEEMRGHPGNPFPTRSIRLSYSFDDEDGWAVRWLEYFTNIGLLLEQFGPHIHFAEICFNEDEESQAALQLQGPEIDALLREGLILLPNLKVVSISGEATACFKTRMSDSSTDLITTSPGAFRNGGLT
ncbi:hypothetical protein Ocin01_20200 [Orchesella cincta]|uniref:Uncharacterized protein n=1 Tax=Orchesella cincta TaxID=48709 RepID=A0A1D2M0J1_ORCCI|nr:hypothetical protein Ocin01_20200 [Orchesella cincta]